MFSRETRTPLKQFSGENLLLFSKFPVFVFAYNYIIDVGFVHFKGLNY